MQDRLQNTWYGMATLALLAAALVLGACSARSGAGETVAQPTASRQPAATQPELTLPTPTATPGSAAEPSILLPTPTPSAPDDGTDNGTDDGTDNGTDTAASFTLPPGEPALLLDLPALVLAYDEEGIPSLGGIAPLSKFTDLLPATVISQLTLSAAQVEQVQAAGIQHLMVSNAPSGLRILVNGQPLPALVWDQQSLNNLLTLLGPVEESWPAALRNLLATLTNLGVGLVVQFPPVPGAAALPLIAEGAQSNAERAQANRQAFLARTGAAPVLQIPVMYGEDGAWTVQGLSDTEWQALTGLPFGYVRLNPDLVRGATAAGIRQVIVWTDSDGIHLTVGERELPYLRWADGGFYTLIDLLLDLGIVQNNRGNQALLDQVLDEWLPALQAADVRIVVQFPQE